MKRWLSDNPLSRTKDKKSASKASSLQGGGSASKLTVPGTGSDSGRLPAAGGSVDRLLVDGGGGSSRSLTKLLIDSLRSVKVRNLEDCAVLV